MPIKLKQKAISRHTNEDEINQIQRNIESLQSLKYQYNHVLERGKNLITRNDRIDYEIHDLQKKLGKLYCEGSVKTEIKIEEIPFTFFNSPRIKTGMKIKLNSEGIDVLSNRRNRGRKSLGVPVGTIIFRSILFDKDDNSAEIKYFVCFEDGFQCFIFANDFDVIYPKTKNKKAA